MNVTPITVNGTVSELPCSTADTVTPIATAKTAGSRPRTMTSAHHAIV
jgi:hypothetical protein